MDDHWLTRGSPMGLPLVYAGRPWAPIGIYGSPLDHTLVHSVCSWISRWYMQLTHGSPLDLFIVLVHESPTFDRLLWVSHGFVVLAHGSSIRRPWLVYMGFIYSAGGMARPWVYCRPMGPLYITDPCETNEGVVYNTGQWIDHACILLAHVWPMGCPWVSQGSPMELWYGPVGCLSVSQMCLVVAHGSTPIRRPATTRKSAHRKYR